MKGSMSSVEGVLADLLTPILPNIEREPKIEGLINIHLLICGNVPSLALNIRGG